MLLHPLVGLGLGRAHHTSDDDASAMLGRPAWGPSALLADLELRLGLPARNAESLARIAAFRAALEARPGVFAASARVDPWGTAKIALAMRDALVEAGWDGAPIDDAGARVADVTRTLAPGDGEPDRLKAVVAALRAAPYPTLTLAEPPARWPGRWRALFARLAALGTAVEVVADATPRASEDGDLARVQRFLAGGPEPAIAGDGSLVLLRAETVDALAPAIAALLAARPDERAVVVRAIAPLPLDAALAAAGLPRLGGAVAGASPVAAAWVPLVLRLARAPFDPEAAIDLLLLPRSGLTRYQSDRLASAIADEPGLGGEAWRRACAAIGDGGAEGAALARMLAWLTPDPALDAAALAQRLEALSDVLAARARRARAEPDVAAEALELARAALDTILRALPASGPFDARPIDALLRLLEDRACAATTRAEAGHVVRVDAIEGLLGDADTIVWWGFVEEPRPPRLFRPAEARALAASGVALVDPVERLRARALAARGVVMRARRRLVLALPERLAGERQVVHPLWSELVGRLGARAVAPLVRSPDELSAIAREPVSTRALPPRTSPWTVPAGLLAPADGAVPTWSVSALETLVGCPLKYVAEQHAKVRRRASGALHGGALVLGRIGHALVERLHADGGLHAHDVAGIERALDVIYAAQAAHMLGPGRASARRHYTRVYVRAVAALAALLRARGLSIASCEQSSTLAAFGGNVTLRTDLRAVTADDRDVVIDLKWSTRRHRDALERGRAVQLAVYVRALAGDGRAPAAGLYFGLTRGDVAEPTPPTALDETWRRLDATVAAIGRTLAAGRVPVADTLDRETFSAALGLDVATALPHGEGAACAFCALDAACGRAWREVGA